MSSTSHTTGPVKVFYSYSRKDKSLRNELDNHLSGLVRSGRITEWHDDQIRGGMEWEREIRAQLESSHLILLLISSDFLASDYCCFEMQMALERQKAGKAHVIPIILRAVDWEDMPFHKFQALPKGADPVDSWEKPDEAFASIARGIRHVVETILPTLQPRARSRTNKVNQPKIIELPPPYRCDRSEQETELYKALQSRKKGFERRPFVCIIHGDDYACLDMFQKRLKYVSLPRLLDLGEEPVEIKEFRLEPPAGVTVLDDALRVFHRNLARELGKNIEADDKEILEELARYKVPILIYLDLEVESWVNTRSEIRDAFFKFWEVFPDLPLGRLVIACLSLTYKRSENMGVFDRWRYSKLNRRARALLADFNFADYGNLHGAVLPELRGIREQDVKTWIKGKNFRELCQDHDREFCNVRDSLEGIRSLYDSAEYRRYAGEVPMELLAKDLTKLIEEYRC